MIYNSAWVFGAIDIVDLRIDDVVGIITKNTFSALTDENKERVITYLRILMGRINNLLLSLELPRTP